MSRVGRRREEGKLDFQGGGTGRNRRKNRKSTKRREPQRKGQESGVQGTGSGKFKPPCPSALSLPPAENKSTLSKSFREV